MEKYILLTGASTGIGAEMAGILAGKGYNLILVARSLDKLTALKAALQDKSPIDVHVISKDLSVAGNAEKLYTEINSRGLEVNMHINNAGVGAYGEFLEIPLAQELEMIQLNVSSLVALTKLYAKEMELRGGGKILNIASLLSFLPFPYYSVYSATKAFVLTFSETIAAELEETGVEVTALCPGPVDTPFTTEEMMRTNAYATNKPISPVVVAEAGVKLLLHGKGKKVVGFNNWFLSNLPRITPDRIMMKIKKKLASKATS
ncbi:MAG: SDR family oxidoreductase [Cyclobacteriaceae bacterium]